MKLFFKTTVKSGSLLKLFLYKKIMHFKTELILFSQLCYSIIFVIENSHIFAQQVKELIANLIVKKKTLKQ